MKKKPENFEIKAPKKMTAVSKAVPDADISNAHIKIGQKVNHERFGRGEVLTIEGKGADAKAEIKFHNGDVKKLLLRFAKLEVLRTKS